MRWLRSWVVRWTSGTTFEKSKVQFSLEPLSQPAALLSGETVLWYNSQFRTRLLGGQDVLASRVQKLLPGLDLQLCRKREGQLLTLADGYWSVHSSTVPGEAESMTLLVLNEETELRRLVRRRPPLAHRDHVAGVLPVRELDRALAALRPLLDQLLPLALIGQRDLGVLIHRLRIQFHLDVHGAHAAGPPGGTTTTACVRFHGAASPARPGDSSEEGPGQPPGSPVATTESVRSP